jgi:mevalonate pyrophosphate decarboxylase
MSTPARTAKLKPEPYRAERIAAHASDIEQLRGALRGMKIVADDETIFDAWVRYSDEHAASWLALYSSDEDNVAALLRHVDLR